MPRVTVNDVELEYVEEGAGKPVVFVHGVWMSSRFFDKQRPYFAERHRYLALDLRGHGRSEHVDDGHILPQYGRDLRAFLEAVGAEDAVVVGWSMGAMVAWDMIDQFGTEGLRALVVVDQSPSDYKWPDWPDGFLDFDGLRHVMEAVQADQRAMARDLVGLMLARTPEDDEAAWMVEEISRPPAAVASAILYDQTVRDYREALAKVDVPSLVLNGRHDKLIPVTAAEFVATTMPEAPELVVFEDSGHCPFLEESERFNEVVGAFVASH